MRRRLLILLNGTCPDPKTAVNAKPIGITALRNQNFNEKKNNNNNKSNRAKRYEQPPRKIIMLGEVKIVHFFLKNMRLIFTQKLKTKLITMPASG